MTSRGKSTIPFGCLLLSIHFGALPNNDRTNELLHEIPHVSSFDFFDILFSYNFSNPLRIRPNQIAPN